MKFTLLPLVLVTTMMTLSSAVTDDDDDLHLLRRELGRCKRNGRNCEVEFTKAKWEPGGSNDDDKCILKYKLTNKRGRGKNEEYRVVFKKKDGAKIRDKDKFVKCVLKDYDGSESGDGDGLPPKLEFDTERIDDAKYDGDDDTYAKVKSWEDGEDLVLKIFKPD